MPGKRTGGPGSLGTFPPARSIRCGPATGHGSDDDGGVQLGGPGHSREQPGVGEGLGEPRRLVVARLDQQATAGCQPRRRCPGHAALHLESVLTTIQRHPRLVVACLGREQLDRLGGDVRRVGDQNVDAAPQPGRQRLGEIALVDVTAGVREVAPGAPNRLRVDVDGVQLGQVHGGSQRHADGPRPAAQVEGDGPPRGSGSGLVNEELASAAWDEHAGIHADPQTAELRPAHDVL